MTSGGAAPAGSRGARVGLLPRVSFPTAPRESPEGGLLGQKCGPAGCSRRTDVPHPLVHVDVPSAEKETRDVSTECTRARARVLPALRLSGRLSDEGWH